MKKKVLLILFLTTLSIYPSPENPRLLIKIPTRSRPKQFFNRLKLYYKKLSRKIDTTFLITCDSDDTYMNNPKVIYFLKKLPNLYVYFGSNKTKIEAYNADIDKHLDFDILLVASDDMEPIVDGYDEIIVDEMKAAFPDFDGVLNFHDGFVGAALNTMPIMGKKYFDRFGYIYHPDYISEWCDTEFTLISRALEKEKVCDQVIIMHRHYAWGQAPLDALYQRNNTFGLQDKITFQKRYAENFKLSSNENNV